jgi:hypothetical protein
MVYGYEQLEPPKLEPLTDIPIKLAHSHSCSALTAESMLTEWLYSEEIFSSPYLVEDGMMASAADEALVAQARSSSTSNGRQV